MGQTQRHRDDLELLDLTASLYLDNNQWFAGASIFECRFMLLA